ncbi:iron-containing redox enzyme family protein [Pseudomonas syringae]|uniref:TenA family transcriptional regulator n=1 Tax=Pseudomonas syringae TaxID=317 RepID=UPI001CA9C7D3|nr:iron-containing redox enzyme family protein [Pseudomonas syringae]MCI3944929.1 iron-containing redox enzyme family protein [Pseudomonas syringae]
MYQVAENTHTPAAGSLSNDFILQELAQLRDEMIQQVSDHPFLVQCRAATMPIDRLKSFLVQQGKYSRYFTRYICQLMTHLEGDEDILAVFENLFEELGFGEVAEPTHSAIYRDMLRSFDLSLEAHATLPSTQHLIDTMMNFCKQPNSVYGLSALCLGAEAIVPHLYSDIVSGFKGQGVAAEKLRFFTVHIECDDGHADTLLAILSRLVVEKPARFEIVRHAAFMMIKARLEFLDKL